MATGICLVIERDPITTAKEVATLDFLSGGRFLFGVGAGWNVEEMRNHGTDAAKRFGLLKERVEAMKAICAEEEASYHGRYVDFDRIWSWPKPVQQPIRRSSSAATATASSTASSPTATSGLPNRVGEPERLRARVEELRRRGREEQGREIGVTLYGAPTDRAELQAYERAGVTRAVFWLRSQPLAELEGRLDRCAVQWGPEPPSLEQGAVLKGCLP